MPVAAAVAQLLSRSLAAALVHALLQFVLLTSAV
jgi:hypothetical protein